MEPRGHNDMKKKLLTGLLGRRRIYGREGIQFFRQVRNSQETTSVDVLQITNGFSKANRKLEALTLNLTESMSVTTTEVAAPLAPPPSGFSGYREQVWPLTQFFSVFLFVNKTESGFQQFKKE